MANKPRPHPDRFAVQIAEGILAKSRPTEGQRVWNHRAVLDLATAYRRLRKDHITECRCRAEEELRLQRESDRLRALVDELQQGLDLLDRELANALPAHPLAYQPQKRIHVVERDDRTG